MECLTVICMCKDYDDSVVFRVFAKISSSTITDDKDRSEKSDC